MNKYRIENPNNKDVREYKSRMTESLFSYKYNKMTKLQIKYLIYELNVV